MPISLVKHLTRKLRSLINGVGFDVIRLTSSHGTLETHLNSLFCLQAIDLVLDVGANKGQYAKRLRQLGYNGYIESFEPVSGVYQELVRNAESDPKWNCHNLALGSQEETKDLNVYSSTVFSSFLHANDYSKNIWRSLETVRTEAVQVKRLDQVFPEIADRTRCRKVLLKMDTQGFDRQVFEGALGMLSSVITLQTELSMIPVYAGMDRPYAMLEIFNQYGFEVSAMECINRDPNSQAVIEFDCVPVRHQR